MKLLRPLTQSRNRDRLAVDTGRPPAGRRDSDTALAFLSQLAAEFSVVLNLQDLLAHVIRTCRVELGFDSCSLALVDEDDQGALRFQAASGLRSTYIDIKIPAGQGLHGEVVRTGQPLLVPDMTADPRVYQLQPGIQSGIYAPLMVRNRVVGVLSALRSAKDAFTHAELHLLTVVAGYAAGAVEVARLHERLKEQVLNSSHQLAEALDLVSVAMIIASVEDGTILRWNLAAADIYGYTKAEAVGQPVAVLEPVDQRGPLGEVLAALRRGESARSIDVVHMGKEGRRRRVALTAHPMRNEAGKVRWVLFDVMAY